MSGYTLKELINEDIKTLECMLWEPKLYSCRTVIGWELVKEMALYGPRTFPLDGEFAFFIWKMIYLLREWLGVATYFYFIFKG